MREGPKPEQIKLFSTSRVPIVRVEDLEAKVNKWLVEHEGAITITGRSASISDIDPGCHDYPMVIIIWYRLHD